MGTAADFSNISLILKNIWAPYIKEFMLKEKPLLGYMDRDTSWVGKYQLVTLKYGGNNGRSTKFAQAQANKGPSILGQFQVDSRDNYATFSVDHKIITASRSDKGALVKALAQESKGALYRLKRSTCWMAWGNGGGSIGCISAISGSTFTLVDKDDARNYEIGDVLHLSADDGGLEAAGLVSAGIEAGSLTVAGVNYDTGVITCSAGIVASVAGAVVGMFVFPAGDYGTAFHGIPAYVTTTDPGVGDTPASLWGQARTAHPARLAGHRFTGTVATATASIQSALSACFVRNVEVSHLFVSPVIFDAVVNDLGEKRRYIEEKVGGVGYEALSFTAQGGAPVKLFSDPDIRKSADGTKAFVYGLNMEGWKFHTMGDYPMDINDTTGAGKFRVEVDSNASEGRFGGYGNFYTDAPGDNFVLALTI